MYETLLIESEKAGILVMEQHLEDTLGGLYCDNTIAVNSRLVTGAEKACSLVEEMGHHYKTYNNILNLKKVNNIKQEKIARNWGYEKLIPLSRLIEAFNQGVLKRFDLAEHLGVTEEFLDETVKHYKEKYGAYCEFDGYVIYFEPNLAILRMFI